MTSIAAQDTRTVEMTKLKLRLLSEGLRVELTASDAVGARPALRVRSGSCGGLDLILPDGTWVNAPIHERFARSSPIRLVSGRDGPELDLDEADRLPVRLVPPPAYYAQRSSNGVPLQEVGQLCSDRIGVGLTNACTFYRSRADRCRFCSIGMNTGTERGNKADDDIVEAILAALRDPVAPARHILLGGGTPNRDDAGAARIAALSRRIKLHTRAPIYAMLAPPRDLTHLSALIAAGVDEVGMNIEVFDEAAGRRYIPGKQAAMSREEHLRALERCVELFGPVRTRSIVVVGLEPVDDTIAGVARLASMGVLPILSPLRPLDGTLLQDHPRLSASEMWEVTQAAAEAADRFGVPLGPTCIACQSNTLTYPGHELYRLY